MHTLNSICIIDDDSIFTLMMKKMIDKLSLSQDVISYENGKVAYESFLKKIETNEKLPDLIFLDINMPEMDGWQFLEAYAQIKHKIAQPIAIYQTSSTITIEDRLRSDRYQDIKGFISKSVKLDTLKEIASTLN